MKKVAFIVLTRVVVGRLGNQWPESGWRWRFDPVMELEPFWRRASPWAVFYIALGMDQSNPLTIISSRKPVTDDDLLNIAIGKIKSRSMKRNLGKISKGMAKVHWNRTWKSPRFDAEAYKKLTDVN